MKITEDFAWAVYNFIGRWKNGDFGEVSLQYALDMKFSEDHGCARRNGYYSMEEWSNLHMCGNCAYYIRPEGSTGYCEEAGRALLEESDVACEHYKRKENEQQ